MYAGLLESNIKNVYTLSIQIPIKSVINAYVPVIIAVGLSTGFCLFNLEKPPMYNVFENINLFKPNSRNITHTTNIGIVINIINCFNTVLFKI